MFNKKKKKDVAEKKVIDTSLKACLGDLSRDVLDKLATSYNIKSLEYKHTIRVIEEIEEAIKQGSFARKEFEKVLLNDIGNFSFFLDLVTNEKVDVSDVNPRVYEGLKNLGLVFLYNKEEKKELVIPKDVIDLLFDQFSKAEDFDRSKLILQYFEGAKNLYGILELDFFVNLFNSHNGELYELSLFELLYILKNYYKDEEMFFVIKNQYIVSKDLIEREEDFVYVFEKRKNKKFFKPNKEILLKYTNPNYFHKTMNHINLKNFIDGYSTDPKLGLEIVGTVCNSLNASRMSIDIVIKMLKSRGIVFEEEKDVKELVHLYRAVERNTRKWSNRGCTDKELGK